MRPNWREAGNDSFYSGWAVHSVENGITGAHFGSTYTKIETIQRRLAWPLRKDDTQIREVFHIFKKSSTIKHGREETYLIRAGYYC